MFYPAADYTGHDGVHLRPVLLCATAAYRSVVCTLFLSFFCLFVQKDLHAQCVLVCNQGLQVSLPDNGQALITTGLIAPSASTNCPGPLELTLFSEQGQVIPNNILTCAQVGQTVTARVRHTASGNLCTGEIAVADFLAPTLQCPNKFINCTTDPLPASIGLPVMQDNCTASANLQVFYADVLTELPCGTLQNGQPVSQKIDRSWSVTDANGNEGNCIEQVWVRRATTAQVQFPPNLDGFAAPTLSCGQDPNDLSLTGEPTLNGFPIENNGPCGIGVTFNNQTIPGCSPGSYTIIRTWTVLEFCNSQITNRTQVIRVEDKTPPVLQPIPNLSVGTQGSDCSGVVLLPAAVATDACAAVSILPSWQFGTGYGPFNNVIEGTYTVTYTATDACGNSSTQTMQVTVADDQPPQVVCNGNLQVSLGANGVALVNASSLNNGSWDNCGPIFLAISRNDSIWGSTVALNCADLGIPFVLTLRVTDAVGLSNFCEVNVTARDFQKPTLTCPPALTLNCLQNPFDLALTGNATATDNCSVQSIVFQDNTVLNGCNIGSVSRRWTATDGSANTRTCTQVITLLPVTGLMVAFPADITLNGCGTAASVLPPATGSPQIGGPVCFAPTVNYTDQIFTVATPACFRILRSWKVIDQCIYDPNGTTGVFTHTQQITVIDQEAPILSVPANVTVSSDLNACTATVNLSDAIATDCSNSIVIQHNSAFASSGANASGIYPIGEHLVQFTASDGCGNTSVQTLRITVRDQTPPNALCINGLSLNIGVGGVVQLSPALFNGGSSDNCSPANALTYAIQPPFFGCQQVGVQPVQLTVTDLAGNTAVCSTFVQVQDNGLVCARYTLSGLLTSLNGQPVPNIQVTNGQGGTTQTDSTGRYTFVDLQGGKDYTIRPSHNTNWLNGVTTFDLSLISKHILGLALLNTPEKIIAADANRSGSISTFDIVQLRKIILGMQDTVSGGASWQFVPKSHQYADPTNPFLAPVPNVIVLPALDANRNDLDFHAIKTGDLNLSANPALPQSPPAAPSLRRIARQWGFSTQFIHQFLPD